MTEQSADATLLPESQQSHLWWAFVAGGILCSFAIDLLLPLGIAGGILYVAPVLLTMWLPGRQYTVPAAVLCSVLTIVGFALSPDGAPLWAVLPNRALAIAAIWTVSIVSLERRRIERALSDSEAKTMAILATTADGILTMDACGRIISMNPAAERMFGHPANDLSSNSLGQLLGPADALAFDEGPAAWLEELVSSGSSREVVVRRASGAFTVLELTGASLDLQSGKSYTLTARDISRRRAMEQQVLHSSERERRALGHGLHEELGQTLTGLQLMSSQLARRLRAQSVADARDAEELALLLGEADQLALRLFQDVAPVEARGGLAEALVRLVGKIAESHGISCTVECGRDPLHVTELHAGQIHRIVQDLVGALFQCATTEHLHLEIGGEYCFKFHVGSMYVSDADSWREVVDQAKYRASLIDVRLQVRETGDGDVVIACPVPVRDLTTTRV